MRLPFLAVAVYLVASTPLPAQQPPESLVATVEQRPALIENSCQAPAYPDSLRAAGVEGRVMLEFVIDTSGTVEQSTVRVLSSSNLSLEAPARAAILTCRFQPGRIHGIPVQVRVQQPINYGPVSASHRAAVLELLEVTNARSLMDQILQTGRQDMRAQNPEMDSIPGLDSLLDSLLTNLLPWDSLEAEIAPLYVDLFTEAELREMIAFYRTELGQMMLARMPELMQRSMMIVQRDLANSLPAMETEIQRFLEARYSRKRW